MQQVQDLLEFNIDTPSDGELKRSFIKELAGFHMQEFHNRNNPPKQEVALPATTRNQKKRARRKSRRSA